MSDVPKITHQIWMQGWDVLPSKFHGNVKRLHDLNPNYTHMKWDEEGLRLECRKYGEECLRKFDSFQYMISKVDFGRYVLLYHYGGFSVDTDMKPLQPLDKVGEFTEKNDFLISSSAYPFQTMVNNGIIICRPHHPILKDIIDTIIQDKTRENEYILKEMYVHNSTGPLFIARHLEKYKDKIFILENKYFEPCLSVDPYCKVQKDSVMDHQHEMSWFTKSGKAILDFLSYIGFFFLYYFFYIVAFAFIVYLAFTKGAFKKLNFRAIAERVKS